MANGSNQPGKGLKWLRLGLWTAVALALVGTGALHFQQKSTAPSVAAFRPAFTLPDSEGRIRTVEEFRGRYLLVFFGFTNCPDICPTTLSEVANVMDTLGATGDKVQPIFISIDPERDRGMGIDAYAAAFHPTILPLTGDEVATRDAAASFRIFYERESDPVSPGGYTMSHSPALYLIGPDGDWLRQFSYGTTAEEIVDDLKERI